MKREDVGKGARLGLLAWLLAPAALAGAGERSENFDRDPGWEGRNHHSTHFPARTVRQAFGFSRTHHAGGKAAGEVGGLFTPAAEPAYYAKPIAGKTFA